MHVFCVVNLTLGLQPRVVAWWQRKWVQNEANAPFDSNTSVRKCNKLCPNVPKWISTLGIKNVKSWINSWKIKLCQNRALSSLLDFLENYYLSTFTILVVIKYFFKMPIFSQNKLFTMLKVLEICLTLLLNTNLKTWWCNVPKYCKITSSIFFLTSIVRFSWIFNFTTKVKKNKITKKLYSYILLWWHSIAWSYSPKDNL
jgi:hypothetical protein